MSEDSLAPLWRRIQIGIESEIRSGQLPDGARLPAEPELASRYGAHRHTVRRALSELVHKGLVRVEQGRGSFVHHNAIDYPVGRRTRVEENLLRQNMAPAGRLLSSHEAMAEPAIARALKLRGKGARVVVAEVLNEADGVPVSLVTHLLPARRFANFAAAFETNGGSITSALAALGVPDFSRTHTRVSTRLPSEAEAKLLRQPKSLPVLLAESVEVDAQGVPIKYGIARFAGDRVQLVLEV